jgi:hypothetical protein
MRSVSSARLVVLLRFLIINIPTYTSTKEVFRTCAEGSQRQKQALKAAAMEAARRLLLLVQREERGCCAVLTLRPGRHERCRRLKMSRYEEDERRPGLAEGKWKSC